MARTIVRELPPAATDETPAEFEPAWAALADDLAALFVRAARVLKRRGYRTPAKLALSNDAEVHWCKRQNKWGIHYHNPAHQHSPWDGIQAAPLEARKEVARRMPELVTACEDAEEAAATELGRVVTGLREYLDSLEAEDLADTEEPDE
jgi:hypothetical protein